MNLLELDPRWRRFHDAARVCPCCGQSFSGVFDIGFDHPSAWPHGSREEHALEVWETGSDKLSADLCRIGSERFLRSVLALPIRGADTEFLFSPWAHVSRAYFDAYVAAWQSGDWQDLPDAEAELANDLPEFPDARTLPCQLVIGDGSARPALQAPAQSALGQAQREGINFDQLLDIYRGSGVDVRPHLMT